MPPGDLDLGLVLDHYEVQYKGDRDSEQMIACPVHEDSRPSASLNLGKGVISCHACGFGGDAIALIMNKEEVKYQTALEKYEAITGTGNSRVRKERPASPVPPGQGYKPIVNRKLPPGVRKRPDFGA